ncbi:LysR family transcriptional regulator [Youngiibacter fragilis]|uniref:LysR family transcriptional regulator n=1 Tax=Youngiibacter fragilis 232.1 TaxID=994573 RepID=V7I4D9_9CLOT|nr:LysR family transcriptional regulator [Youngiibacter fragilis]ETA80151.1 LysR family transcriptional regulator [Youngiibacter fragilis 232.1]
MDFKQLKYLIKVADLQSITKAAEELYVSQPSLSHYIKKIENELGVDLFNRSTNPLSLTLAGEKYIETAKRIIRDYERMEEEVRDMANINKGRLKIGIPNSRAAYMLPHILPEFTRRFPGIEILTVEAKSSELKEQLIRGILDFIVIPQFNRNPEADESLSHEVIYQEELFLISSEKLQDIDYEDGQTPVRVESLQDTPFILLKKGHGIRLAVDKFFESRGFMPLIGMETTSNETAYRLASAGMGVAIVPEISLYSFRTLGKPYIYRLNEEGVKWDVVLLHRKADSGNPKMKLFLDIVKERFSKLNDRKKFFGMDL